MNPSCRIEMFYDGDCPLCMRETRMLRRLDCLNRIRFTDIAATDFDVTTIDKIACGIDVRDARSITGRQLGNRRGSISTYVFRCWLRPDRLGYSPPPDPTIS